MSDPEKVFLTVDDETDTAELADRLIEALFSLRPAATHAPSPAARPN